jgi:hypothetical protein
MDETAIRMTVVINPLVTPLLFEQLSACQSARRRAARLKALAEASLRQQLTPGLAYAPPPPTPSQATTNPADMAQPPSDEGFQVLRIPDADGSSNEGESEPLADAFAGYFD